MCKLEGCIPLCAMKVLAGIFAPAADQLADRGSSWSISIGLGGGRWVVWERDAHLVAPSGPTLQTLLR